MTEFAQEIKNSFIVANELIGQGKFELAFEDDRCSPREAVTVVRKLLDLGRVDLVTGGYCNSCLFRAGFDRVQCLGCERERTQTGNLKEGVSVHFVCKLVQTRGMCAAKTPA